MKKVLSLILLLTILMQFISVPVYSAEVAIVGENEISENRLTLKNMLTGEQEMVTLEVAIEKILDK